MRRKLGQHLSYANVTSTLAVFIALGGSSYAALHLRSRDIANNTLRSVDVRNHTLRDRDVRRNALTGRSVRESRLGRVPRARDAYRVGGLTAQDLLVKCPLGTFPTSDVCVETTARAAAPYSSAILVCSDIGRPAGPGRRLPTHGELRAALAAIDLTPGGELTSEIYPASSPPGTLNVLYVTDEVGSVAVTPDSDLGAKAYRCVADPLN